MLGRKGCNYTNFFLSMRRPNYPTCSISGTSQSPLPLFAGQCPPTPLLVNSRSPKKNLPQKKFRRVNGTKHKFFSLKVIKKTAPPFPSITSTGYISAIKEIHSLTSTQHPNSSTRRPNYTTSSKAVNVKNSDAFHWMD